MSDANELWVRTYSVRFGDAFLVSVPDRDENDAPVRRHILIDVGNVLAGKGGKDSSFEYILDDVQAELDGRALDLYVMTHEHMDHCQGLPFGALKGFPESDAQQAPKRKIALNVDYAWLTASAEGKPYYDRHPDAKKHFDRSVRFYDTIERQLAAAPQELGTALAARMLNNNPRKTADCVKYLRKLASEKTSYVYRGCDLEGTHPFRDVRFEIWAPEEDTSAYYGRFRPMAFGATHEEGTVDVATAPVTPTPPPGVDVGAFYDLVEDRARGAVDNLFQIDKARNNSSVVFMMEWRGWRLLFTGDAEIRSWKTMNKHGALKPVHFVKVSHHGSHNGTPAPELVDKILPAVEPEGLERHAVVSTCEGTYSGVPDAPSLEKLAKRCVIHTTDGMSDGEAFDMVFTA